MVSRGASTKPCASVTSRRRSSAGHGRSGLTWSAVTGETPPQSSMPASSSTPKSSDRFGRRLQVDLGRKDQPGHGDGLEVVVGRARRRLVHARAGLGQEVLDDHLLHVAVAGVARRRWPRAHGPGRSGSSPMPTRMPGGERDAELAGGLEGGQPTGRLLVGRPPMALQVVAQGLDHHPLRRRHRPELRQLVRVQGTGVGVGEQAGLVEHQLAHRRQVVDRRRVPVRLEPLRGRRIAQLGPLAQGEQRLVAAGVGAAPGRWPGPARASGTATRAGPVAGRTCSTRTCRDTAS